MLTDPGGLLATCAPPPELCGPDVTAWFEEQLRKTIGALLKNSVDGKHNVVCSSTFCTGIAIEPVFKQFWKTLDFTKAKLSTQCGRPTPAVF